MHAPHHENDDRPEDRLDPQLAALLDAYRHGLFPMADPAGLHGGGIGWYDPPSRGVLPIAPDDRVS